jgi:hypothetical protein
MFMLISHASFFVARAMGVRLWLALTSRTQGSQIAGKQYPNHP